MKDWFLKWKAALSIGAFLIWGVYSVLQNQRILDNQERINDRLDLRDAYLNVGMKETAKKLEKGYMDYRMRELEYIEFNRQNPCQSLPTQLAVALPAINYISPEALFMGYKEE